MSCNKKKYNCGNIKQYAVCTQYEGDLPEWSELDDCADIEETTEELYNKLTEILSVIDVSDFLSECENFDIVATPTLRQLLTSFKTAIEELKCATTEFTGDVDLESYDLDLKCLVDECNVDITKLSQLLQLLINKGCKEVVPEVLINTGAIDVTEEITHVRTTSISTATLAAGSEGQDKFIMMTQYGGNLVIGVPDLNGGTNLTFNALNDFVKLFFSGGKWNIIANNSVTVS